MSLRTITVIGGDLFQLASKYLGDPLQWTRIATANGLWDPRLPNVQMTLTLPARLQSASPTGVVNWNG